MTSTGREPVDPPADPRRSPRPWQRATPNALTLARLVMTAAFVALLAVDPSGLTHDPARLVAAAALFAVAAITDALDGYLARRWHATSPLGRILDPFADKFLTISAFVLLAGPAFTQYIHAIPGDPDSAERIERIAGFAPWMVTLIIGRELLVTTFRGVAEASGAAFGALGIGKAKMVAQSIAIPALILIAADNAARTEPLVDAPGLIPSAIAWIVTLVTLASAAPYIHATVRAAASGRTEQSTGPAHPAGPDAPNAPPPGPPRP